MRTYRSYDLVTALFVAVLLLSNLAAAAKLTQFDLGPISLTLAGGTLLFPLSYIFGDILTEVYGYARSRRVIWMGFGCTLLMTLTLASLAAMPPAPGWGAYVYERMAAVVPLPAVADMDAFGQAAYDAILGSVSNGAIIVASLLAYFAGEFSNSFVLAKLKVATRGRWLWSRTISSTVVGQGVDTGLFILIATALGVFPWSVLVPLLLTEYTVKVAIEVFFTPLTYTIVNFLKRVENEDYFDRDTDFNPFRLEA